MNPKNKKLLPLFLAVGGLGLMLMVQVAGATHPRPKAASPVSVSLVPAYEQCTSPNTTHGPPLQFPSCTPPVQTSRSLTVGTFDANGAAANSVGLIRVGVHVGAPGPPEDSAVQIRASITDVRCKAGVSPCGPANAEDGPDYTGQLEGNATVRISDHNNGPNRDQPATVRDIPMPFPFDCASTADTSIGSTCAIPTGTECLSCPPPKEGVRTVIELTQLRVSDGGADGLASTDDNSLFMVQGVFLP